MLYVVSISKTTSAYFRDVDKYIAGHFKVCCINAEIFFASYIATPFIFTNFTYIYIKDCKKMISIS